jgi:methyltransferase-like protein
VNEPREFHQFVREFEPHGLAYVGDSATDFDRWAKIPPPLRERIYQLAPGALDREQYLDFLIGRTFRWSVLCRGEATRRQPSRDDLLRQTYVSGNFSEEPAGADPQGKPGFRFKSESQELLISDPRVLAVLRHIRQAWPMPVPFAELIDVCRSQLKPPFDEQQIFRDMELLVRTYFSFRLIEVMSRPSTVMSPSAGEFPKASKYTRWTAAHGYSVPSLRHKPLDVDDSLRDLIVLLDGSRVRKAIGDELARNSSSTWKFENRATLDAAIETALGKLANMQLLMK